LANPEIRATFILRLWRERDTPPGEWRAEVAHVQAGRVAHFADRAVLFDYIETQLAEVERSEYSPMEEVP